MAYEGTEEEEEPPPPPTPPGPERNGQRGGRETAARCRLAQLMSERDVAGRAARHVDKRKQKHRVAGVKTLQNWQKGLWANGIVIK